MEIKYRFAELKDVAEISKVMADTWKVAYRGIFSEEKLQNIPDDRWVPPFIKRLEDGEPILIASVDGHVVAAITYGPARRQENIGMGEISSIHVLPDFQGYGIGKNLLMKAVDELPQNSVYVLVATENTAARRFYEAMGFEWNGQVIADHFGDGDFEEAVYFLHK